MKRTRDFDRAIDQWLGEGSDATRPEVIQAVLLAVRTMPQERDFRVPWRIARTTPVRLAAVVVALAVVGLAAVYAFGPRPNVGSGPSPSEAERSVEPSPAANLPVGSSFELMVPNDPVPNADLITVTIPAPGWSGEPGSRSLTKDLGAEGRATVTVLPPEWFHVPSDICRWQSTIQDGISGAADDLVAALAAQTYATPEGTLSREPTAPVDVTVGGDSGQSITLGVPTWRSDDPGHCDAGRPFPPDGGVSSPRFCSLVDRDRYACWLSHLDPGYVDTLWVMGSGASPPWIVDASYPATASAEVRAEIDAIVNSMITE